VSASDIQLSWDHPPGGGDNIISYELYYNDSVQRRGVHVTVSPPVGTYLLEDLSPDTVYHIRLSAKSLRGEGVPTATIQVRTLEYGIVLTTQFNRYCIYGVTIAIGSPGNAGGPEAQNGKGGPKRPELCIKTASP